MRAADALWLRDMVETVKQELRALPEWKRWGDAVLLRGLHLMDRGPSAQTEELAHELGAFLDGLSGRVVSRMQREHERLRNDDAARFVAELVSLAFFGDVSERFDRFPAGADLGTRN